MSIDKNKVKTQDELAEPAPIDQVEERVDAEMRKLEVAAKRDVAEGLKHEKPGRESNKKSSRTRSRASQD